MKKLIFFLLLSFSCQIGQLLAQCSNPTGPAGDDCATATPICDPALGIDEYCDSLDPNNVQNDFPGCPNNVLNNDEWFSFVASGTNMSITITPTNCGQTSPNNPGVQAALYEGSCTGAAISTQCDCTTAAFVLAGATTPGQTYYIVIDGCAGDICDYQISDPGGTTIPTAPPNVVPDGPDQVCPGLIANYTLPIANGDIYQWTISPPNLGMFVGGITNGASVDIEWLSQGMAQLCVQGTNACGQSSAGAPLQCMNVNIVSPPPVMDETSGCVFELVECSEAPGVIVQVQSIPTTQITTLTDAIGCQYDVICEINPIIPGTGNLGQEELCAPDALLMCGGNEILFNTGIYNVTCQTADGCDSIVIVDLAVFDPVVLISTPIPTLDCSPGATVVLNAINSTTVPTAPGSTVTLLWTGPGIVGANNQPLVTVNAPGQYCLTVTEQRNGTICSEMLCVTVNQTQSVPNAPTIVGELAPCEGNTYLYDANPNGNPVPNGYNWTLPAGVPFTTVDANTIQVNWTGFPGGQVCVVGTSTCGNSAQTCVNVVVGQLPAVPNVTGDMNVCAVNVPEAYTITNPTPNATYAWTAPAGATINGSGTNITVNFNGAALGAGQVCATATNACGTTMAGCFNVVISAPPPVPVLSGPTSVCSNGTGYTYTVSNGPPGSTYNWTVPPGAVISGSGASIGVDFSGASTGPVCVTVVNECGNSNQVCLTVSVQQVPSATISGTGELCEGTTGNINLTITLTGTSPWNLEYTRNGANPTPLTINNSPFTLTVTQPGTYALVNLVGGGGCNGNVQGSAVVSENPLPTAQISGTDDICANNNEQGQLTVVLTGEAPWSLTWASNAAAQAPVVVNASPYSLNVSEAQAGTITLVGVTDNNDCDGTVSGSGTITVNEAPQVVSVERECDATNTSYTVTIVIQGGDPTSYSVVPANGSLVGNTFVSNPILSSLPYNFIISDDFDCDPVFVQGTFLCNCDTRAGTMPLTQVDICGNGPVAPAPVYNNTNEVRDGDDDLIFILHSGNGTTVVNPIVGQYTVLDNIVFNPATMTYGTTYYLSAVVGNSNGAGGVDLSDPCLSISLGTPITFLEIPTATLSGSDAVCLGETGELQVNFTGEGPWSLTYDDGSGIPTVLTGINTNPYTLVVTPTGPGTNTFCLLGMGDANCPGTTDGCGEVVANTGVMVDGLTVTCNATATGFVVSFNISGGDPASYTVTGIPGTISGGVFTSNQLPTGPGLGFSGIVSDANDCDPQTVSQTQVICDCETDAGAMSTDLVETCGIGPATVTAATNTGLDPDDVLFYYLHTGNADILIGVLAVRDNPALFTFDAATMTYGTTYYVSAVAGNPDPSGNGVDPNDPCRDIVPGTPVVFYEIPTANLLGGTTICPGDQAVLMVELTGDSPWAVNVNGTDYSGINTSPFSIPVTPTATTTYQLTSVTSEDNGCSSTLSQSQTVTIYSPPTLTLVSEDCNPTGTAYTVCFTISGGTPGTYQVSPNTGTLTGNQFCSTLINSGNGYTFSVTDAQGCAPALLSSAAVNCDCPTQAGDLDPTPLTVCRNAMTPADIELFLINQFLDPDDVLCYALYNGTNVLATNPNSTAFSFNQNNMVIGQTYTICPVAGNNDGSGCVDFSDPCLSIGGCVEVVFTALPTATMSGNVGICQNGTAALTVNLTGTGPWQLTYQNTAGAMNTVTATNNPYTLMVTSAISTGISLTQVVDANGCTSAITGQTATITVNQPPTAFDIVEDCNVLETEFTVSFTINGGNLATYAVDPPGTIVGNVYTSNPIPSGSLYTFLLDDANQCGPTVIDGGHACNCFTQVGQLPNTLQQFCQGGMATVNYNSANELLDPNDVRIFVLTTSNNPTINQANVLATTQANPPTFAFNPATMTLGTTYYIAAVVGNGNGSGGVDFTDLCLSTVFTPIVFNALPTVAISAPAAICAGQTANISVTVTGAAPFTVNYLLNGVPMTLPVPTAGTSTVPAAIPVTSTFTLVSIQDARCTNVASQTVTVTVNQPVEAGTPATPLGFCENTNQTVQLFNQLIGADAGGVWTNQAGQTIPNGSLNVGSLPPGENVFNYTITAQAPCPDDQAQVTVDITQSPVANAGQDATLNCDVTSVQLSTGNTTPGAAVSWAGPGISAPLEPNPVVTEPGTYILTAIIGTCIDTDEVLVERNITTPVPVTMPNDVSCFGRTDGFVLVESVDGGEPPYLFSLDGGPFVSQQSFLNLAPGTHTITVEDNAGCTATDEFVIGEPEEVTVNLTGVFTDPNGDPIIKLGESATITANTTPGFGALDTIIWRPAGVDSACVGCPQIEVSPTQQTTYEVTVDKNGCQAKALITVFISKDRPVFVPNAFSPNDDLINDKVHIFGGPSVVAVSNFSIFNRWGEQVYGFYEAFEPAPRSYEVGWDGKHRGEFMNPGVYVWFAEVVFTDGSVGFYEGDITLVR